MLLRVSTKKLRFRNRENDFYPPAFGAKRFPPVTMSVSEISLCKKSFRPFAVLRVTRGGEASL